MLFKQENVASNTFVRMNMNDSHLDSNDGKFKFEPTSPSVNINGLELRDNFYKVKKHRYESEWWKDNDRKY